MHKGKGKGPGLQCQVSNFHVDASPFPCSRCTEMDHSAKWCPRKSAFCIGCGKKGHLLVSCRNAFQATQNCKCCGDTGHVKKDCSHKDSTCQVCKKARRLPAVGRYRTHHRHRSQHRRMQA